MHGLTTMKTILQDLPMATVIVVFYPVKKFIELKKIPYTPRLEQREAKCSCISLNQNLPSLTQVRDKWERSIVEVIPASMRTHIRYLVGKKQIAPKRKLKYNMPFNDNRVRRR